MSPPLSCCTCQHSVVILWEILNFFQTLSTSWRTSCQDHQVRQLQIVMRGRKRYGGQHFKDQIPSTILTYLSSNSSWPESYRMSLRLSWKRLCWGARPGSQSHTGFGGCWLQKCHRRLYHCDRYLSKQPQTYTLPKVFPRMKACGTQTRQIDWKRGPNIRESILLSTLVWPLTILQR